MTTIGLGGAVGGTGVVLTNIEKAEDAAHTSGDKGIVLLAVRKDTATALAGTDADYIPLIVDANGRLHVLDQNSSAIKTAVELIDNAISGAGFNITQLGGAATPIGAGVEATAVRVTLPTDGTGVVKVGAGTAEMGKVNHAVTSLGDGRTTVTTAGTAVALAASTACKYVDIQSETDNTGVICVGGSTVVAALGTRRGIALNAGQIYRVITDNLADVYLDSTVNGEGVTYTYGI